MAMQVPYTTKPKTQATSEGLGYLRAPEVDTSPITRGLNVIANAAGNWAERERVEQEQSKRFKALDDYTNWQIKVDETLTAAKQSSQPDVANFPQVWEGMYQGLEDEFIANLPADQQEEFRVRAGQDRRRTLNDAMDFSQLQRRIYSTNKIDDQFNKQSVALKQAPDTLQEREQYIHEYIDRAPGLTPIEKEEKKRLASKELQAITYGWAAKRAAGIGATPGDMVKGTIRHHEQFRDTPYWDVNAYRVGYGSDTITREDGTYFKVTPGMKITQADAERDLDRRTREFQKGIVDDIGSEAWAKLPENVQAGLTSVAYNYGKLPGSVVRAVKTGDPRKMAMAVGALEANPDRRLEEAQLIYGDAVNIDDDPRFAMVPLEDRLALRKQAEVERNAEIAEQLRQDKEQHATYLNDLYNGLRTGKYGQREYDENVEAGLLDDYSEREVARKIIEDRDSEKKFAREGAQKIGIMGRGGSASFMPSDADDNKRLDAVIGDDGVAKINASDSNYVDNYLIPTIRTTHVIPSNAGGTLNAMMRSRDPKKALWALDVMSRIQDQDPRAFDQRFDEKTARDVDFWRTKKQYYTQEDLLAQINGGDTQEQRVAKIALREEAEKLIKDGKKVSADNFIDEFDGYFSSAPQLSNVPWAAAELSRDYNAVFTEEYTRYGNVNEAHDATVRAMSRIWGVTEIGGIKTLMKYPPEKVGYNPVNYGMDWIDRQVRNELNIPEDSQFQLLETPNKTEQEFARWKADPANNHPPAYNVAVRGPDGAWRTANGPDGKPARIYFQVTPEERAAEERSYALNQALTDYTEFMTQTYIPRQNLGVELGQGVEAELEAKKKELETRLEGFKEQANIPAQTSMLPARPNPRNQKLWDFIRSQNEMTAPTIEELFNAARQ